MKFELLHVLIFQIISRDKSQIQPKISPELQLWSLEFLRLLIARMRKFIQLRGFKLLGPVMSQNSYFFQEFLEKIFIALRELNFVCTCVPRMPQKNVVSDYTITGQRVFTYFSPHVKYSSLKGFALQKIFSWRFRFKLFWISHSNTDLFYVIIEKKLNELDNILFNFFQHLYFN